MIAKISALVNKRLTDLGLEDKSINQIIKNSKLSFSDNLDKGHLTTNIAMVGAGVAKRILKRLLNLSKKVSMKTNPLVKLKLLDRASSISSLNKKYF